MVSDLIAGIGAFKTMFDLAKSLKDINDSTVRNAAIIDLQEKILAAREAQSATLERIRELEAKVANFEKWETERQRYQLERLPPGVFVYSLRNDAACGECPHSVCQTGYQRSKKSLLNSDQPMNGIYHLTCNECETVLRVGSFTPPSSYDDNGRMYDRYLR